MKCSNCRSFLPISNKPNKSGLCKSCYQRDYSLRNKDRKRKNARAKLLRDNPHKYGATCGCGNNLPVRRKYDLCIKCRNKKWRDDNKSYIRDNQYKRYHTDIEYRLRQNVRSRIKDVIVKNKSTPKYLGCSISELKAHLESKFQPGMTWDNYGKYGWHIDHVRPLVSFNLSNQEEQNKACHYSNLQPLWAKDNLRKGSKYELL